jgi:RNA-directed DNA polymerase
MTRSRYPWGSAAGSKERGIASSPGDYAWNVNFNNGNANYNHQDYRGLVRAVRARECQDVSLQSLHTAWRRARRAKRPSANQLTFDTDWLDHLLDLQRQLNAGAWSPAPPTCFIAQLPKAREIHAPDFADRVVHHWLVPQLEAIYEPAFIYDSYSNRVEKGTHAAVDRLRTFVRQVHSGQGGGWYLQLDIRNFFNSIHRPTLYMMLKARMERHALPEVARRAAHALLRHSPIAGGVHFIGSDAERARVPAHKRLENAAPGCGLAIGNLSSQFFANVYLDALDQFVKHKLGAKRYLRYVDDFVLVHQSREQLQVWRERIEQFLQDHLRLELKADIRLKPLTSGCDFLGYCVYPTHTVVRRRVIGHAQEKLAAWQRHHVRGSRIRATPAQLDLLRSVWRSYDGHFSRADSHRLIARFQTQFPWLRSALYRRRFDYRMDHQRVVLRVWKEISK